MYLDAGLWIARTDESLWHGIDGRTEVYFS